MNPFEAFKLYLAVKYHFATPKYDYFKYNGQMKVSIESFEKRRDKYSFHRLAGMKDPLGFILANITAKEGRADWIGDLMTSEECKSTYEKWLKRSQALHYTITSEIQSLSPNFKEAFLVTDGGWPPILTLYRRKKISPETLVVLDQLLHFIPYWDKKINETAMWPQISMMLTKYRPFIDYDPTRIKPKVLELMKESNEEHV